MVILGVSLHLLSFMSIVCLLLTTSYVRRAPWELLDILLLCFPFWHTGTRMSDQKYSHWIDLHQSSQDYRKGTLPPSAIFLSIILWLMFKSLLQGKGNIVWPCLGFTRLLQPFIFYSIGDGNKSIKMLGSTTEFQSSSPAKHLSLKWIVFSNILPFSYNRKIKSLFPRLSGFSDCNSFLKSYLKIGINC